MSCVVMSCVVMSCCHKLHVAESTNHSWGKATDKPAEGGGELQTAEHDGRVPTAGPGVVPQFTVLWW